MGRVDPTKEPLQVISFRMAREDKKRLDKTAKFHDQKPGELIREYVLEGLKIDAVIRRKKGP